MTPEQIGEYLEHQGATDDEIDEFLEHFGVKGMKWGVRRQKNRDARSARLKSGTATRRDKYIREMDLDGGRTEQIKKGTISKPSKTSKALFGVAAAVSISFLGYQMAGVLKERQQLSKSYSLLRQMPDKERAEVGKRLLKT